MIRLAIEFSACLAFIVGMAFSLSAFNRPACELRVTDSTGHMWIAGTGTDSESAWQGAAMPDDWRSIETACQ